MSSPPIRSTSSLHGMKYSIQISILTVLTLLFASCLPLNHFLVHPRDLPPTVVTWGEEVRRYSLFLHLEWARPAGDGPFPGVLVHPEAGEKACDMFGFSETPRQITILNEQHKPVKAGHHDRRFFEGPWMHKYNRTYYFSYSTGTSHYIVYATGNSPDGPFTFRGRILNPVAGWSTHHSIMEFKGRWYLFYHDSEYSGGINHFYNFYSPRFKKCDYTFSY